MRRDKHKPACECNFYHSWYTLSCSRWCLNIVSSEFCFLMCISARKQIACLFSIGSDWRYIFQIMFRVCEPRSWQVALFAPVIHKPENLLFCPTRFQVPGPVLGHNEPSNTACSVGVHFIRLSALWGHETQNNDANLNTPYIHGSWTLVASWQQSIVVCTKSQNCEMAKQRGGIPSLGENSWQKMFDRVGFQRSSTFIQNVHEIY